MHTRKLAEEELALEDKYQKSEKFELRVTVAGSRTEDARHHTPGLHVAGTIVTVAAPGPPACWSVGA